MKSYKFRQVVKENVGINNPVFVQILGICSTLAVTNVLKNTVVMCAGLVFVTGLSNLTVSLLRKYIPGRIRMMVETLIIAAFVIIVDVVLKAFIPDISRQLGPYVGLIITNCIIMGRAEAFAMKNPPLMSVWDGLGNAVGYSVLLLVVGTVRELFGSGMLFGIPVFKLTTEGGWYPQNGLLLLSPSAFFLIGFFIWALKTWKTELVEEEQ